MPVLHFSGPPFRLHRFEAQLLRPHPPLVRDLLREVVPLELAQVLEVPHVVVVVVPLPPADESVVQALRGSWGGGALEWANLGLGIGIPVAAGRGGPKTA